MTTDPHIAIIPLAGKQSGGARGRQNSQCAQAMIRGRVKPAAMSLILTLAETAQYDPAPEREGEIAVRERLEPEGSLTASGLYMTKPKLARAQNGVTARRDGQRIEDFGGRGDDDDLWDA